MTFRLTGSNPTTSPDSKALVQRSPSDGIRYGAEPLGATSTGFPTVLVSGSIGQTDESEWSSTQTASVEDATSAAP